MLCLLKSGWVRRSGYYPLTGARVCLKVKQNNNQTQVLPGAFPVTSAQPNNYTLQDTVTLYKKLELSVTLLDENPSKWNIFWFYEALDLHPQAPWLWNQLHPTSIPFHLQQSLNDELMFIFCMMAVITSALHLPHSFCHLKLLVAFTHHYELLWHTVELTSFINLSNKIKYVLPNVETGVIYWIKYLCLLWPASAPTFHLSLQK